MCAVMLESISRMHLAIEHSHVLCCLYNSNFLMSTCDLINYVTYNITMPRIAPEV